ncbi:MAG TPA: hypothetical protein EYG11_17225 [Candidatus Latescibacteria bacterium]|nr:hypothetical protein [Candidatus Latescibacterota bacterium]
MEEDRNLLDYIYVLVKWRRMIGLSVLLVVLATAGISLFLPEKWTANTMLLPHEEEMGNFEMSMLMSAAVPGNIGGLLGQSAPGDRLVMILKSRRVLGAMVDRFGLVADYGVPNRDLAMEALAELVETELGNGSTLKVQVEASSAKLAADLANALAAELDVVMHQQKRGLAMGDRVFLEGRLDSVQRAIEVKAIQLQRLQEQYGIVDLKAQTEAIVGIAQHIVQELTLQEVKLGVARGALHPDHEEHRLLEMEVGELRHQLDQVVGEYEHRAGAEAKVAFAALGPPLKELPELGMQFARYSLELKLAEHTLTLLVAQLEGAKLRQAKKVPAVQVLDRATPPEYRSAPRRTLIVFVAALLSLLISVVLAFIGESLSKLSSQHQEKLKSIGELMGSRT